MPEPIELVEMRAAISQARGVFRASLHTALIELLELGSSFELAVGEVSASEALAGWREAAIAALAQHVGT